MLNIPNYKKVSYKKLVDGLKEAFDKADKPETELSIKTKKSTRHIQNLFKASEQKVTDSLLTTAGKLLNFDCIVVFHGGERFYYIPEIKAN
jgi:hypothetical protein